MAIYATDFSDEVTGQQPNRWTRRWDTTNGSFLVQEGAAFIGGKYLECGGGGSSRKLLTWDLIDGDAGRDEVDILLRYRNQQEDGDEALTVVRGSGALGAEYGYRLGVQDGTAGYMLGKYVNSTFTNFGVRNWTDWFPGDFFWVRAQCWGSTIRMKRWRDGEDEPTAWNDTQVDIDITAAGWVGITKFVGAISQIDYISVGTGGDLAQFPDRRILIGRHYAKNETSGPDVHVGGPTVVYMPTNATNGSDYAIPFRSGMARYACFNVESISGTDQRVRIALYEWNKNGDPDKKLLDAISPIITKTGLNRYKIDSPIPISADRQYRLGFSIWAGNTNITVDTTAANHSVNWILPTTPKFYEALPEYWNGSSGSSIDPTNIWLEDGADDQPEQKVAAAWLPKRYSAGFRAGMPNQAQLRIDRSNSLAQALAFAWRPGFAVPILNGTVTHGVASDFAPMPNGASIPPEIFGISGSPESKTVNTQWGPLRGLLNSVTNRDRTTGEAGNYFDPNGYDWTLFTIRRFNAVNTDHALFGVVNANTGFQIWADTLVTSIRLGIHDGTTTTYGATSLSVNEAYAIATTYDAANTHARGYLNGKLEVEDATFNPSGPIGYLSFNSIGNGEKEGNNYHILTLVFNRKLDDAEVASLSRNPFQIFKPARGR